MKICKSIKLYLQFNIDLNKLLILKLGMFSPFLIILSRLKFYYKSKKNDIKPQNKLTPIYIYIRYY